MQLSFLFKTPKLTKFKAILADVCCRRVFAEESTSMSHMSIGKSGMKISEKSGAERREFRRHDLETQEITVDRWDGGRRAGKSFGRILDLSAGGVRIRTSQENVKPDNQIRVRLELPAYAGISPFINNQEKGLAPKNEWVGWMTVNRVAKIDKDSYDIAGRLVDMDEIDRGMLGLYLSTQPLAA
jgi:hypothetical protein